MGTLKGSEKRTKNKYNTSTVHLSNIPPTFFSCYTDESLTPSDLSSMFGVGKRTIRKWKKTIRDDVGFQRKVQMPDEIDIDELVVERVRKFERKTIRKEAEKCFPIEVLKDGPIAIAHFGDPHVDDDGTNLGLL